MVRSALVLALALVALPVAGPAVGQEAAETPSAALAGKTPSVTVIAAAVRSLSEQLVVTGSIVPRERVFVSVDLEGYRIAELLVDEGDTVAAGDVVARLATDTIEIQLAQNDSQRARSEAAIAQALTQITEAEATEKEAAAALVRAEELTRRGVTSQDVLEQRTSAAATAAARLASARQGLALAEADKALIEAQRREIELRLSKAAIRAPAAGLVLSRSARVGAIASAAGGPLFEIARDGEFELAAEVTEVVLARLMPGQSVSVTLAGAAAPIAGKVRLVSPEIDAATRLGKVHIALPGNPAVRTGAFARGEVVTAETTGIAVPVSAVATEGGESSVLVVRDGKVASRPVKTGITADGYVELVEGLAEGEQVVARAGSFLRDGDAVTPVAAVNDGAKG